MNLKIKTAPASLPVTTADMKLHLRVDQSADDTLIDILVGGAMEKAETETQRALITQTWYMYLDGFPLCTYFYLPKPPLQSVTSIKYNDVDGAEQTLSTSVYGVDKQNGVASRIYLKENQSWPDTEGQPDSVTIEFVCGYGVASAIPKSIIAGIKLLVGHWYENREAVTEGARAELPMAVDSLFTNNRAHQIF